MNMEETKEKKKDEIELVLEKLAEIRGMGYSNKFLNDPIQDQINTLYKNFEKSSKKILLEEKQNSSHKEQELYEEYYRKKKELQKQKLKQSKDYIEEAKKYKTLSDTLAIIVKRYNKRPHPFNAEIFVKQTMKSELDELEKWKMDSLNHEDTRLFRDLNIAYEKLEEALEFMKG